MTDLIDLLRTDLRGLAAFLAMLPLAYVAVAGMAVIV